MLKENNKKTLIEIGDSLWRIKASGNFADKDVLDFVPTPESSLLLIDTPEYDGPLDLLLHLIKKHSIDIFDIPIVLITEKYLAILDEMKELNLDVAGEFLLMAATLAYIKSQMLLPKKEIKIDGEENEEIDPRKELVERLLKYKYYQDAASFLFSRPALGEDIFYRKYDYETAQNNNDSDDIVLAPVEIFDLLEVFAKNIKRAEHEIQHVISRDRISVSARISELLDLLGLRDRLTFLEVSSMFVLHNKTDIIVTFLSLLEMAKLRLIKFYTNEEMFLCVIINKENFYISQEEVNKILEENDFKSL